MLQPLTAGINSATRSTVMSSLRTVGAGAFRCCRCLFATTGGWSEVDAVFGSTGADCLEEDAAFDARGANAFLPPSASSASITSDACISSMSSVVMVPV